MNLKTKLKKYGQKIYKKKWIEIQSVSSSVYLIIKFNKKRYCVLCISMYSFHFSKKQSNKCEIIFLKEIFIVLFINLFLQSTTSARRKKLRSFCREKWSAFTLAFHLNVTLAMGQTCTF